MNNELIGREFKIWSPRGLNIGLGAWLPTGARFIIDGPRIGNDGAEIEGYAMAHRSDVEERPGFINLEFALKFAHEVSAAK